MKSIIIFITTLIFIITTSVADTSFSGTLRILPEWRHTKTLSGSTISESISPFLNQIHTSGTNENQMNSLIAQSVVLTNVQQKIFDLSSITNNFGDTIEFTEVNFILVKNLGAHNIIIGGADSNTFPMFSDPTDSLVLHPWGTFLLTAPLSGYSSTNSNFQIENTSSNNVSIEVYFGGK